MQQVKQQRLQFFPVLSVAMIVITIGAAFGVLAGRGPLVGMLSAAVMTTVTALVGGSRYGVTSPTGPMTAAIAVILLADQQWIAKYHPEYDPIMLMNLTVVVAGLMLVIFVALRLSRFVRWVPQLAISGFVNGIAVLIILSQVQVTSGLADWTLLLVTFLISMLITRLGKRSSHLVAKIFASSFGVLLLMSLFSHFFQLPVSHLEIEQGFSSIQFSGFSWDLLSFETVGVVGILALELALIALLDTLLTAIIIDKKTGTKTKYSRELIGQSFSFFAVSLFGGLPGAQSTVPSMMMVEEGNHHRYSKILLAIFCIALTFVFVDFIQYIPKAVFGGLIIKIACDVADFTSFRTVLKSGHRKRLVQLILMSLVLISTVLISINLAVIGCTIFFMFWNRVVPESWAIPDLIPVKESEGLSDEI